MLTFTDGFVFTSGVISAYVTYEILRRILLFTINVIGNHVDPFWKHRKY